MAGTTSVASEAMDAKKLQEILGLHAPYLERVPDFYCSNEAALADIQRCAEIEAAQAPQVSA
jgi:hypothetical protein